jgi:hypothetical protein
MRTDLVAADPAGLMKQIIEGTESEVDAASVMRSLERLGSDPSIEFYEITQVGGRRRNGGPAVSGWRVRADRGSQDENGR